MKTRSVAEGGFSLIELMIVVAIISILAAVAYPSYQEHVRRAARADARSVMLKMAQYQERNFTDRGSYVEVTATTPTSEPWVGLKSSSGGRYSVTVALNVGTLPYVITATAATITDSCSPLTLDSNGVRGSAGSVDLCWK